MSVSTPVRLWETASLLPATLGGSACIHLRRPQGGVPTSMYCNLGGDHFHNTSSPSATLKTLRANPDSELGFSQESEQRAGL